MENTENENEDVMDFDSVLSNTNKENLDSEKKDNTELKGDNEKAQDPEENDYTAYLDKPNENITDEKITNPDNVISDDLLNSVKPSKRIENSARFLDKGKIIMIIGIAVVVLCSFFAFVLPLVSQKKEIQNNELDKTGAVYIPGFVENWLPETNSNGTIENADANFNNEKDLGNQENLEIDFDEKFPPIVEAKSEQDKKENNTSSSNSTVSQRPDTWANEQQKNLGRISLERKTQTSNSMTYKNNSNETFPPTSYMPSPSSGNYTPSALNENIQNYLQDQNQNSYERQNNQTNKESFMNSNKGGAGHFTWNTEYSLFKGTVIPAVLETAINTDLPGIVMARVTTNIYSSLGGKYILIPQGSILFAQYNSSISYNQNRVQVAWDTLIRPDGLEINLGNMNGVDMQGRAGNPGYRNVHPFEYAKAFGLIGMFSIINTKYSNTIDSQNNTYVQNALADVYSASSEMTNKILDKALDVQPTITIPNGSEINLITNVTMDLPPIEPFPVIQKYKR